MPFIACPFDIDTGQAASHRQLDDLFQSMLHCAFQGDL